MDRAAFLALVAAVEARSSNLQSHVHGPQHWRCVAKVGIALARATPGADPLIALLFGLFHDSMRVNDHRDYGHGARGADLADSLFRSGELKITDGQLVRIVAACRRHTGARPTKRPNLGVCFDADRLNLWRVGTMPEARFLSTAAAPGMIEETRDLHRTLADSWADLYDELADGCQPSEGVSPLGIPPLSGPLR